jgi:hypothetical protein
MKNGEGWTQAPANTFRLNLFPIFLLERTWLRLFLKRVVWRTKFYIYVVNTETTGIRLLITRLITSNCSSRGEITVSDLIKWRSLHVAQTFAFCVVLCRPVCLFCYRPLVLRITAFLKVFLTGDCNLPERITTLKEAGADVQMHELTYIFSLHVYENLIDMTYFWP